MSYFPDFESFRSLATDYSVVPVFRRLICDSLTPVSAAVRLGLSDWSFLFESVIGGEKVGRYSFIGFDPFLKFVAHQHKVVIQTGPRALKKDQTIEKECQNPLKELQSYIDRYTAPSIDGLPRFIGGAVGFSGYDAVRYVEHLPNPPQDDRGLPDLCFGFYDKMVLFDHIKKQAIVVALAHIEADRDLKETYQHSCETVDSIVTKLSHPNDGLELQDIETDRTEPLTFSSNFSEQTFCHAVDRCKEYIKAGDFFQIVLSQRLQTKTTCTPFDIYRTLRIVNPSPFMVYFKTPDVSLVASSPEIMVRVESRMITNRPLAGTRPRGKNEAEDSRLADELLNDPKERAEHIMLVDLGRNDVGKVSKASTVELSDLMTIEKYSHVMHITSNVLGELKNDLAPLDALIACLPAGTVSGAPKVRAMQVIDEIEPHRRGPYAGAIGYIDFTGNMDTCIALRTMVIVGDDVYIQAGAGIVYDSDPIKEYEETLNKAKGLLKAVQLTEQRVALKVH